MLVGVFEAKAGPHAAGELSFARDSTSGLGQSERTELTELQATARDAWREQRAAAKAAQQPCTKSVQDVMKECALSERGGPVRRDIVRLAADTGGPTKLRVPTQELVVGFSPTRTTFFGVIPKGCGAR